MITTAEAQKWNKENNNRWSVAKLSNDKFQAQVKKDSVEKNSCLISVPEYKELTGPQFNTVEEVKTYITQQIEKEIEWHWFGKSRWDFDLC